jgi:hypothetical protein
MNVIMLRLHSSLKHAAPMMRLQQGDMTVETLERGAHGAAGVETSYPLLSVLRSRAHSAPSLDVETRRYSLSPPTTEAGY